MPARGAVLLTVACVVAACGIVTPATPRDRWEVPAEFAFLRDDARILPAADRALAEEHLRFHAETNGVFGVVLTGPDPGPDDAAPVIAEVERLGGAALVAWCSPTACDLSTPAVTSAALSDAANMVAPAPAPASGQGLPPPEQGLQAWIEYVGAVANLPERTAP
jgi:hypothetical protein